MSPRFIALLFSIPIAPSLTLCLLQNFLYAFTPSAAFRFDFPPRLTNDGNAILREIDVAHPAAKNMIELSRTQDEECGDGTTSVIILGTPISASLSHTAVNLMS